MEFDPVEAVPGTAQAQAPAQTDAMMGGPSEGFMAVGEVQNGASDVMHMQQQQTSMGFGQPQLAAVDMEA